MRNHAGPRLLYTLRFDESAAGLQSGTAVQLRGVEIGNVTEAKLVYDPASGNLYEAASMSLDPSVVQLARGRTSPVGGSRIRPPRYAPASRDWLRGDCGHN